MTKDEIRRALKANPDGLTLSELVQITGKNAENGRKQFKSMHDVYIDRWQHGKKRSPVPYVPVYMLAPVPEDCPMPE